MPGRNGAELLAVVRRRFPEMRRVLLSGWTPEIAESELDAAAPDAVHAKPWDDEALKASIRSLLVERT
jgi:DNA-binding NarL/FixJ family response regulator